MNEIEIRWIERKSALLSPSSIACLSGIPTINLSAGCMHDCMYCYTKGYSFYPGVGRINIYKDLPDKLRLELKRKRKLPRRVYFSPSSDVFQPIEGIQQIAAELFKTLLDHGIEVAFLTKGLISDSVWQILVERPKQVFAQIGLITYNDDIRQLFEPGAASVSDRLNQMKRLVDAGITTTARMDPIIPEVTDATEDFENITLQFAQCGIKQVSASILFLRPGIASNFYLRLAQTPMPEQIRRKINRMCELYKSARYIEIQAQNSKIITLPFDSRAKIFTRLKAAAHAHDIQLRICSCKNPDISTSSCEISGAQACQNVQLSLLNDW